MPYRCLSRGRRSLNRLCRGCAFKRAKREWEPWRASKSPATIESNYKYVAAYFKEERDLVTIDRDAMLDYARRSRSRVTFACSRPRAWR